MEAQPSPRQVLARPWIRLAVVASLAAFLLVSLLRTAWLCDDAYITFRTVDNVLAGFGPRYNVAERVQTFTHPLWLGVLTVVTAVTRDVYYGTLGVSMLLSLVCVLVLGLDPKSRGAWALVAVAMLTLSRSYVDYSTSGLENPLSHLLLVLVAGTSVWVQDPRKRALGVCLVASLVGWNRLDQLLLVGPLVVLTVAPLGLAAAFRTLLVGFLPLIGWELFSIAYYGFPFPNTAYAKLATGLTRATLLRHGLRYLGDFVRDDPVGVLTLALGPALALASRERRSIALAIGACAYVAYVVVIGGDFMSTRFFTGPLVVAACCIARSTVTTRSAVPVAFAATLAAATLTPHPSWRSGPDYGSSAETRPRREDLAIRDERAVYYGTTGLLRQTNGRNASELSGPSLDLARHARAAAPSVVVPFALGFVGYEAGPDVHFVDRYALTDAFIARLPGEQRSWWQPGHVFRAIPEGYVETLVEHSNRLTDPGLARYYDVMQRITRGPLFTLDRWRAIWGMNTRAFDHWIDVPRYSQPGITRIAIDPAATSWSSDAEGGVVVPDEGMWLELGRPRHDRALSFEVTGNVDLQIRIGRGDDPIDSGIILASPEMDPAFTWVNGGVSATGVAAGFDRVEIYPARRRGTVFFRSCRLG